MISYKIPDFFPVLPTVLSVKVEEATAWAKLTTNFEKWTVLCKLWGCWRRNEAVVNFWVVNFWCNALGKVQFMVLLKRMQRLFKEPENAKKCQKIIKSADRWWSSRWSALIGAFFGILQWEEQPAKGCVNKCESLVKLRDGNLVFWLAEDEMAPVGEPIDDIEDQK